MNDFGSIVALIAALAIVVLLIQFQRMDRDWSMALMYFRRLDGELREWLDTAGKVFTLVPEYAPMAEQYSSMLEEYDSIGRRREYRKVSVANKAFLFVRDRLLDAYGQEAVKTLCGDLEEKNADFSYMVDEYNNYASKLSYSYEKRLGPVVRRVFRMKNLDSLESFSLF